MVCVTVAKEELYRMLSHEVRVGRGESVRGGGWCV